MKEKEKFCTVCMKKLDDHGDCPLCHSGKIARWIAGKLNSRYATGKAGHITAAVLDHMGKKVPMMKTGF